MCRVRMYWSCLGVVTCGLPGLGRALVEPVCRKRRSRREIVDWLQPGYLRLRHTSLKHTNGLMSLPRQQHRHTEL